MTQISISIKPMYKIMKPVCLAALTLFTELTYARAQELVARGETGQLAIELQYEIDEDKMEAFIGLPRGSEVEQIGWYNEFGTGQRGSMTYRQYFDEIRPTYTIPIVARHHIRTKKGNRVRGYMKFVDKITGEIRFIKEHKGMPQKSFLRRALSETVPKLSKVFDKVMKDEKSIADVKTKVME